MTPTQRLANLDAARERFAEIIEASAEPAPVYRHAAQLGWLMAQAHAHQMPAPAFVRATNADWAHVASIGLSFDSLADLTAWAQWAGEVVVDLIGPEHEFLGYGFKGAINEVRISCDCFTETREVSA